MISSDYILALIASHYGETSTIIFFFVCAILEKLPTKFSPFSMFFGWIGGFLNRGVNDKLDAMNGQFGKLETDFSNHMVESWRRDILNFASDLMTENKKTKENFDYILKIHDKYAKFIEENDLENGQVDLAYEFISSRYQYCIEHNCFL